MIPVLAEASFAVLDTLDAETLVLFLVADRRPLRGAAGIVDWRLCGELSRALQTGSLTGALGERLLMPTHGRIGPKRLLLFGAGPLGRALPSGELGAMLEAARSAGAQELAAELPENASAEAAAEAISRFSAKRLVLLGVGDRLREKLGRGPERPSKRA